MKENFHMYSCKKNIIIRKDKISLRLSGGDFCNVTRKVGCDWFGWYIITVELSIEILHDLIYNTLKAIIFLNKQWVTTNLEYNINFGKNQQILEKCEVLKQYMNT